MAEFEDWVPLLVLRAAQSLGLFMRPGMAATPEQLSSAGGIFPQYGRFAAEMLAILHRAGERPHHDHIHLVATEPAQLLPCVGPVSNLALDWHKRDPIGSVALGCNSLHTYEE